jgi:hypothetical protein
MDIGDIIIYDRFGDRFASVAPTMDEDDQDVGIIVSEFFIDHPEYEDDEGMSWARVITSNGRIKELARCYLANPEDVSFSIKNFSEVYGQD